VPRGSLSQPKRARAESGRRFPAETVAVWILFALAALAVLETYARLPVYELYHVSHSGLAGGFSRALVFIDFPLALVAIALAAIAWSRLGGRVAAVCALASIALSLVVAWPGVVDQANLDAKLANFLPALGVALALALTVVGANRCDLAFGARLRLDPARLILAIALVLFGLPWLLAEVGFSVSHLPLLGRIFLGEQIRPGGGGETLRVVHLGHHHGADGVYLALSALLLTRALPHIRRGRDVISPYLALMLAYGLANAVQDGWTEQVVKRGQTDRAIPSLLHPSLSWGWAAILIAAAVVELGLLRPERRRAEAGEVAAEPTLAEPA
jgi:hypothetical protein